jgi:hypothetical protein
MSIGKAIGVINGLSAQYAAGTGNLQADKNEFRQIRDFYGRMARQHKWEEEKRAIAIDAKEYNNQAVGQQSRELAKSA